MEEEKGEYGKKVSISELYNWFMALSQHKPPEEIDELLKNDQIPYPSALLKNREDWLNFAESSSDEEEEEDEDVE
jgi:hypothetical protein